MTEEEQDKQAVGRMSPENYQSVIDRLKTENQRLSELLWGSRCVYCGEVIGKDKQNQDIADELLRKHVEVCPKHPVARLKAQNLILTRAIAGATKAAKEYIENAPDPMPKKRVRSALAFVLCEAGEKIDLLKSELALKDAIISMQIDDTALVDENVKLNIELARTKSEVECWKECKLLKDDAYNDLTRRNTQLNRDVLSLTTNLEEQRQALTQSETQVDLADRLAADNLKRVLVLENELAQAKAELSLKDAMLSMQVSDTNLIEENALLRGDLDKWVAACEVSRIGLVLPLPPLVEALHKENQRLAAALRFVADECDWEKCGDGGDERIGPACWKALDGSSACLRGLLTPTIELLEQLTYPAVSALNNEIVHKELDRLRSLTATSPDAGAGG